ncbi:serine hydrolase domain-containing protein [Aquimarina aggregata]|uniref:serine hydrolase domain-containing protein n=1 Tax=Aquimarina aggregata TaxID=1642818 RepID=UPI002490AB2E|nr:serine hydrolase domain-containing protein [Aquimarina aggregata]
MIIDKTVLRCINGLMPLSIILILLFNGTLNAQKKDSILVNGQIQWSNDSINYFPKKVIIKSKYNPSFIKIIAVDSIGTYKTSLDYGEYLVTPLSKYHWQRNWDQGYIRINDSRSKVIIKIDSTSQINNHKLILDTLLLNSKIPEKGIISNLDSSAIKKLDDFINENLNYYQVPGASLAIIKKGKVVYAKNYGVKNPITEEPITEETLFEAGSITKPVFAFAVMRLVERGIIDLDKPLYKYLEFEDVAHDKRYKLITARHVLSHQTGFPNWAERNKKGQFDLLFTPGTKFGYSGEGFEYLKRVIVHILGKDIETILREELITPLNLNNFYFKTTDYVSENASDGFYRGSPTKTRFVTEPGMAYSLMTTAKDFTKFAIAIRNRKGLSEETYNEMFKKQVSINDNAYRGLGLEFGKDKAGNFYGHNGITRDFVTMYRYYPKLDIGYISFVNNITGGWLAINTLKQFLMTGGN